MKLLTPAEAARVAGISVTAIADRIKRGRLSEKKCQCCGSVGIDFDELMSWKPQHGGGGKRLNWENIDPLLGKNTDASVAASCGVSLSAVFNRRNILGIPPFNKKHSKTQGRWSQWESYKQEHLSENS